MAAAMTLSSCVNPIERRVSYYPGLYSHLSEKEKQAVHMGKVEEGMSKDAVYLAWGAPGRVAVGKRGGKPFERWGYQSYRPVFTGGYGYGYGMGFGVGYWGRHRGFYGGFYDPAFYGAPVVTYVAAEGRYVEFVNGRVTAFLAPLPR
ncbi:MAG: hypothetical protein JWO08_2630 [Verrucomicrobiaceae bacterium]|nr:hypothetical protein [Verrucomicrobiaceae bacterium]